MSKDFADLYLCEEMHSSLAITEKIFLAQNNHDRTERIKQQNEMGNYRVT